MQEAAHDSQETWQTGLEKQQTPEEQAIFDALKSNPKWNKALVEELKKELAQLEKERPQLNADLLQTQKELYALVQKKWTKLELTDIPDKAFGTLNNTWNKRWFDFGAGKYHYPFRSFWAFQLVSGDVLRILGGDGPRATVNKPVMPTSSKMEDYFKKAHAAEKVQE